MTAEQIAKLCELEGRRYYWVIESRSMYPRIPGVTNYCCIRDVADPIKEGFMDWTDDVHEALEFARAIDAQRFAHVYGFTDGVEVAIVEHCDIKPLPRLESQKEREK